MQKAKRKQMGAPNRGGAGGCEGVAGAGMATDPSLGRGRCVQQLQQRSTAEADGCRWMAERAPENSPRVAGASEPGQPERAPRSPMEPRAAESSS